MQMSEWVGIPKDNMSCPCLLLGNTAPLVVYFFEMIEIGNLT